MPLGPLSLLTMKPPFDESQGLFLSIPDQVAYIPSGTLDQIDSPTQPLPRLILPSAYINDKRTLEVVDRSNSHNFQRYLQHDLNVSRLNKIHKHLWLAGLPQASRQLHSHVMIGRDIIITERADLHLVWNGSTLYLKPLPDYLLDYTIWKEFICLDASLFDDARGFLYSYLRLICTKSDMAIAHSQELLSKDVNWEQWTKFSAIILQSISPQQLTDINPRYLYGELRLSRLNWISRFCSQTASFNALRSGYQGGYYQYSTFLKQNFTWLLTAIIYVTLALNAMQVGLTTNELKENTWFNRASYGFTVFSILAPLIVLFLVIVLVLILVVVNFQYALAQRKSSSKKSPSISNNKRLDEYRH